MLNTGPMLALMLTVWGLTGRVWIGLLAQAATLGFLHAASSLKLNYLGIDLIYADTLTLASILHSPDIVLGFASTTTWMLLIGGFLAILVLAGLLRRYCVSGLGTRLSVALAGTAIFAVINLVRLPTIIDVVDWDVFRQTRGAVQAGVVGNIVLGKMTTRDVQRQPDQHRIQAFNDRILAVDTSPSVQSDAHPEKPDIVIIQSESLFDLRKLNGFDLQVLPTVFNADIDQLAELEVPVYGGRTLQTEFEVLTGVPVSFYNNSMFIYFEIFKQKMNGLPRLLSRHGYSSIAIHPASRSFWMRDRALSYLGFDAFIDESAFVHQQESTRHRFISDLALMRSVVSSLDAANGPTMIQAITMNNHGPWGKDDDIRLPEQGMPTLSDPVARAQLADYIQRSQAADAALAYLIKALEARQRKTIVLFYGDHLPAMPAVFQSTGFRDGKTAQEQTTPLRVWSNHELPPLPDKLPSYMIPGWLMQASGLQDDGHYSAAARLLSVLHQDAGGQHTDLIDSYAHVAAAGLSTHVQDNNPNKTVLTKDNIDPELALRLHPVDGTITAMHQGRRLAFPSNEVGSQSIALDTRNIDYLILRASYNPKDIGCHTTRITQQSSLKLVADGSVVYEAPTPGYAFRLIPLDTSTIENLVISHRVVEPDAICNELLVEVVQMQCSDRCQLPAEESTQINKLHVAARIMCDDTLEIERELNSIPVSATSTSETRLQELLSHVTAKNEVFGSFDILDSQRIKMHPDQTQDAWIEFDVTGISELTLNGRIEPLLSGCLNSNPPGRENGVIGLAYALDGQPNAERLLITADAPRDLQILINGASTLRINVDKGNDVNWCDHFSLGVEQIVY